jgi:hypothetical protein
LSSSSRDRTIERTGAIHDKRSTFQPLTVVLVDNLSRFRKGIYPRIVPVYDGLIRDPVVLAFFLVYCPVLSSPVRLIVCSEIVSFAWGKGAVLMSAALLWRSAAVSVGAQMATLSRMSGWRLSGGVKMSTFAPVSTTTANEVWGAASTSSASHVSAAARVSTASHVSTAARISTTLVTVG